MPEDDRYYTPEEAVEMNTGVATIIAAQRSQGSEWAFDDLLQEALISIWRAAQKNPGRSLRGGYASSCARRRISDVAAGRRSEFGNELQGHQPIESVGVLESLSKAVDDGELGDHHKALISEDPTPEQAVVDAMSAEYRAERLYWAIDKLNDNRRAAVLLSMTGLSQREIGDRLDLTHQQVNNRIRESKSLLRSYLEPYLAN